MSNRENRSFPKPTEVKVEEKKIEEEKIEVPKEEVGIVDGVTIMLNVRSEPEVGDNIITQLQAGTKVSIADKSYKDWYRIIVTDPPTEGYVMKKYIKVI